MNPLPTTWVETSLGTVVPYGATVKAEPEDLTPDTWVLELEDIEKDTSKVLQRLTFSERQSKSTKNRFDAGDVLYGKLRPYLNKVTFAEQSGVCTTEIVPIKPNAVVNGRYLFYWLRHPQFLAYVSEVSHGVNMPRLGTEAGRRAPFVLAPKNEQIRIADKLDTLVTRVDAVNTRLARVAPILKRFRQSVLAAATSGRLTEDWREPSGISDRGDSGLPSTWKVVTASDVCVSVRDGTHDTPVYVEQGIPLVTSKNIGPHGIDFGGARMISAQDHFEISKRSAVDRGDVLISMIGTVGQVCLVETNEVFSIKNVGLFKTSAALCMPRYLFYWLQSPRYTTWLQQNMRGGNQKFISLGLLRESLVHEPPLQEQAEIVRRVETLFAFADRLEARLLTAQTATERLTPSLLAKAFRGELVPQDPNDEPASELLRLLQQETPSTRGRKTTA